MDLWQQVLACAAGFAHVLLAVCLLSRASFLIRAVACAASLPAACWCSIARRVDRQVRLP